MSRQSIGVSVTKQLDHCLKRGFDLIVASICLVIASPIFFAVAGLVAFTSRGPLFYRQKRVGRDGRLFEIFKFRTMCHGADRIGPSVTSADDTRITRVGRFLRATKLDEIPQLFNVILGDMSLVGPRPQVPRFVEHFNPDLRELVLRVRPGITGPTALEFRNEEQMLANQPDRETYYIRTILPIKLEMDAQYVRSCSLSEDVRILFATAKLLTADARQRSAVQGGPRGA
jgi:lipopolysaccharide/colanic/teichoic acid biosynthesis glycosyltransferase